MSRRYFSSLFNREFVAIGLVVSVTDSFALDDVVVVGFLNCSKTAVVLGSI